MALRQIDEEFVEMGRTKLFDPSDSRKIRFKRKQFEQRINSSASTPTLHDYKEYIRHEKSVLREIYSKRKGYEGKSLEVSVINRTKNLYEMVIQKFCNFKLCMSFFGFCKETNTHAIPSVVANMIKNHSNIPEAWHIAVKFYAYEESDISRALQVAQQGLILHRNNKLLYRERIQLELIMCDQKLQNWCKKPSNEYVSEEEMACVDNLKLYVAEVLDGDSEYESLLEILEMLEKHSFTVGIQDMIVKHLRENCIDEVEVWHVLAQRENKGLFYPSDQGLDSIRVKTKFKLERCCETYKEGLDRVPVSKKAMLWSHYLDCLVQQCDDDFAAFKISKKDMLLNAFEKACEERCLQETHFVLWLEYAGEDRAVQILEKALKIYPNYVQVWQLRMKHEINNNCAEVLSQVFLRGVEQLKERALPLWMAILQFYLLCGNDEIVNKIYLIGVKEPPEVSAILKQKYLEWLSVTGGIEAARQQYSKMANRDLFCKTVHFTMAKLESHELHPNLPAWEKVLKIGCELFGKEDVHVWINYMHFLCQERKDNPTLLQEIYRKGKDSLPDALLLTFEDFYVRMVPT